MESGIPSHEFLADFMVWIFSLESSIFDFGEGIW